MLNNLWGKLNTCDLRMRVILLNFCFFNPNPLQVSTSMITVYWETDSQTKVKTGSTNLK